MLLEAIKSLVIKLLSSQALISIAKDTEALDGVPKPGTFDSWDSAAAESSNSGYLGDELVAVVAEKTRKYKESTTLTRIIDLGSLRTLLPFAAIPSKRNMNIIDFGGASGFHYYTASTVLRAESKLTWHVVETEAMCQAAKHLETNSLRFFSDAKEAARGLGHIDLVFTSGALQCCPNPLAELKKLIDLEGEYLFITRTPLVLTNYSVFTLQRSRLRDNGHGPLPPGFKDKEVTYPLAFAPKNEFESIIKEKYEVLWEVDEGPWQDFGEEFRTWGYFCLRKPHEE